MQTLISYRYLQSHPKYEIVGEVWLCGCGAPRPVTGARVVRPVLGLEASALQRFPRAERSGEGRRAAAGKRGYDVASLQEEV